MAEEVFERLKRALADRYRLEREIGRGGMATVYLAEDLKHRRQVAIKVLSPDLAAALGPDRFLREIELAAKLQHPHIVPVYDSGTADGILYYVMPFVEGESLRELLKREKQIPLARAAEIVRAAASGLAYAHAQGIVHRDVKPENIMLSGGHAVVTDFGIARALSVSRNEGANLTDVGMAMGTPAYMSPEQATADTVDARTDQYALACVFYEMVSGKQAFSASTRQAMLTSILTGVRPRLGSTVQGVSPQIDAATQRALAADPAQRFDSITAFADAVAQETSGAAAATRESRRWKKLAIALPLLVAVLAGGYVLIFAAPKRAVASGAETIAIIPFTITGPGLEGMGDGSVDLLAGGLDGIGAIRTVDSRTVLSAWNKQVKSGDTGLEAALAVGKSVKAASVLTGNIVSSGGTSRLTAQLYDLDGKTLATQQVSGPTDSVIFLIDSLALGVLHQIWHSHDPLPSANVSLINSSSMPAIRAYLKGETFHRKGAWDSAQVAFQEAVNADSTFALAWYRLANTLGWMGRFQDSNSIAAASNAVKFSKGLSPRLRLLMVGYSLFSRGDVAGIDSAVSYTRQFPMDADGWFLLGETQYHSNTYEPRSPSDLLAPFDKVLALDSTLSPAAIHPMEIAVGLGDTALLKRYEAVFRVAGASDEVDQLVLARRAILGEDSLVGRVMRSSVGVLLPNAVLIGRLMHPGMTGDSLAAVVAAMSRGGVDQANKDKLRLRGGHLLAAEGRLTTAREFVRGLTENGTKAESTVSSDAVFAGFADSATYARMEAGLATVPPNAVVGLIQAIVALNANDPVKAQSISRSTLSAGGMVNQPAMGWLRGGLLAVNGLAVVAQGDTLHGMVRADSGMRLLGGTFGQGITDAIISKYAEVEVARPETRLQGVLRLRYGFPTSPGMIPINAYRLGRAYEAAGLNDSSAVQYRRFLAFFNEPDPIYLPLVNEARKGLARVSGDKAADAPVKKKP